MTNKRRTPWTKIWERICKGTGLDPTIFRVRFKYVTHNGMPGMPCLGRETIAIIEQRNIDAESGWHTVCHGSARCHYKDRFEKAKGRSVAFKRAWYSFRIWQQQWTESHQQDQEGVA